MGIEGLDERQQLALIAEVDSTRNLLAYGLRALRTDALIDNIRDPILSVLSIGLEKLYKLALGLAALDDGGGWPSAKVMRGHGHGVKDMHEKVWRELRERTGGNIYLSQLMDAAIEDPVLIPMVDCLDMYGLRGRFYFLDLLGDEPQQRDAPQRYWIAVETAAYNASENLRQLRANLFDDPSSAAADRTLRLALGDRIATSIEVAWDIVAQCGRIRALGPTGEVFGRDVKPTAVGRQ